MAFSRLFYPTLLARDLYEPDYSALGPLGLLNSLLTDSVPHTHLVIRPKRQTSTKSGDLVSDPNKFQVMVNVKHFKPEELSVKTVDNYIVIRGKHEETADEHGFVSREFTRRYAIPEDVEADKIQSSLSQDGVLTIQAPKKCLEPPPKNERVVPITVQQTAAVEQKLEEQRQIQEQQVQQQEAEKEDKSTGDN